MNNKQITIKLPKIVSVLVFASSLLNAQCVVGTNQSGYFLDGSGNYVAWPKNGSRVQAGSLWLNMPASGIQYTYCPPEPTSSCTSGGGDYNFTSSQITSMESAFSAWISAKSANGSNLSFNRVYTSKFGDEPYYIDIQSRNTSAMGTVLARFTTQGSSVVDYNNDGVGDATRLVQAIIEVRTNVTTLLTAVFAHELGHTFGLDDCSTCNDTTLMKTPLPSTPLTAPSACDNAKVASIM